MKSIARESRLGPLCGMGKFDHRMGASSVSLRNVKRARFNLRFLVSSQLIFIALAPSKRLPQYKKLILDYL
jgi:hypothetical protein